MKILSSLTLLAATLGLTTGLDHSLRGHRELAGSDIWAGANCYYLHNLQENDRHDVLDAMRDANLKVLRIFLSAVGDDNKGTGSSAVNDVEVGSPGNWDDTILSRVDQLMVEAHDRGIKLIITLHDRWMLGHWGSDVYVYKYGLQGDDVTSFYSSSNAAADMDRRFAHILTHKNPHFNNRAWGEIDEAVFAFGIENESQGSVSRPNFQWVCDRATNLRQYIHNSNILVASGGGKELDTSLDDALLNCAALDILGVHNYGASNDEMRDKLSRAVSANQKRIYVEEFGATGDNKANDLRYQIDAVKSVGVPWIFWEVSKPGKGSGDYEVWTDEDAWGAIASEAQSPTQQAQTWPELGNNGPPNPTPSTTRPTANPTSSPTTQPTPGTGLGDWQFCSTSSQCKNGCCSKQYSDDGKLKCTPNGSSDQCVKGGGGGSGLGDWEFCSVSSQCSNGCCSKEYSNDGKLKCTPGGTPSKCVNGGGGSTGLGDWQFCSSSSQCTNSCCSKQYSNDGKLKCTPGGSSEQCV